MSETLCSVPTGVYGFDVRGLTIAYIMHSEGMDDKPSSDMHMVMKAHSGVPMHSACNKYVTSVSGSLIAAAVRQVVACVID